jgi:hypothetical protein
MSRSGESSNANTISLKKCSGCLWWQGFGASAIFYLCESNEKLREKEPKIKIEKPMDRRKFLQAATIVGGETFLTSCASVDADKIKAQGEGEEEVSPAEDLMREHGVLKRVLLTYREALRRIAARQDLPPEPLADGARIIREFIEDYHEKLEEDFLFPRFRKANVQVELVEVLMQQHQAGRRLTDVTLRLSTSAALKN